MASNNNGSPALTPWGTPLPEDGSGGGAMFVGQWPEGMEPPGLPKQGFFTPGRIITCLLVASFIAGFIIHRILT